jgi:hypothetical protein
MQLVQALTPADKEKRCESCEEMQLKMGEGGFIERLISDEATFHISGKVNGHNVHIWGTEQPHAQTEHQRDSPKVSVFCGMSCENVHGPFFFTEPTVTGDSFLDRLENWLLPQLNTNYDYILQLDGGPPPPSSNKCRSSSQSCSSIAMDWTYCKCRQQPSPLATLFSGSYTMGFLSLGVH